MGTNRTLVCFCGLRTHECALSGIRWQQSLLLSSRDADADTSVPHIAKDGIVIGLCLYIIVAQWPDAASARPSSIVVWSLFDVRIYAATACSSDAYRAVYLALFVPYLIVYCSLDSLIS